MLNNMILKNKVIVENSKLHYLIKNIEEYSSDRKKKKRIFITVNLLFTVVQVNIYLFHAEEKLIKHF